MQFGKKEETKYFINMKKPLVSIIIVNWNRIDDMLFTLDKISYETYQNLEVVIVDNGSDDGSRTEIPKKYPEHKYINLSSNLGCEEGYNVGVLNSNGEILIYLDSDAYIEKGGIEKMIDVFNDDINIGIIDPLIINYHTKLPQNGKKNKWPLDGTMFTGCAVAFKKEVIERIGLRPGNFYIYASEADVCIRALDAGFKIKHTESIIAFHKESPVKRISSAFFYYSTRNVIWLIFKYYPIIPAFIEIFKHLIWYFILAFKSRNIYQYFKGVINGFLGLPQIFQNERKVLKNWKRGRIYPPLDLIMKFLNIKK